MNTKTANVVKTPPSHEIECKRVLGGKRALWHARHPDHNGIFYCTIVGAGNTADNAILDFQRQFRTLARQGRLIPPACVHCDFDAGGEHHVRCPNNPRMGAVSA